MSYIEMWNKVLSDFYNKLGTTSGPNTIPPPPLLPQPTTGNSSTFQLRFRHPSEPHTCTVYLPRDHWAVLLENARLPINPPEKYLVCIKCGKKLQVRLLARDADRMSWGGNSTIEAQFITILDQHSCKIATPPSLPQPTEPSPEKTCRWCKGTGKITLFTSVVDCECVKGGSRG